MLGKMHEIPSTNNALGLLPNRISMLYRKTYRYLEMAGGALRESR